MTHLSLHRRQYKTFLKEHFVLVFMYVQAYICRRHEEKQEDQS
jgi:hypothetical protein